MSLAGNIRGQLRLCFVPLLVALLPAAAAAQRPQVETFSVGEGLPSSSVIDLAQDPGGRLWILTRGEVSVYDGQSFVEYDIRHGLPSVELARLALDPRGRAWTVTRWSGPTVYRLEGERWRRLPFPQPGLGDNEAVTALLAVARGEGTAVAVGTTLSGLWLGDGMADDPAWRQVEGLPSARVYALAAFEGRIAVGTAAGLAVVDPGRPVADDAAARQKVPLRDPILALRPVTAEESERLWILTPSWLGHLENERLTVVHDGLALSYGDSALAGALAVDDAGGVYFGNEGLLLYLDPERRAVVRQGIDQGLISEGATALLLDREHSLWVAGLRGLSRIGGRRFLSFDRDQGLLEDDVSALVEIAPGRFVAGHNTGLTFLDGSRAELLAFEPQPTGPLNAGRVLDMAVDGAGDLWLAANKKGLFRLRGRRLVADSTEAHIFSVEVDARGRLWTSSYQHLWVRDGGHFREVDYGPHQIRYVRWIEATDDGRLHVATNGGLLNAELGDDPPAHGWRLATGPTPASSNVYAVLAEPSGGLLVGTRAGLFELADERLVEVRRGALAIDRPVYAMLRDGAGQLWFGTDDGVLVWNGARLRHLTVRHGLAGRDVSRGAFLTDHRGRVWIGTDQGLSVYQQAYDWLHRAPPSVELAEIDVNGQPRGAGGVLDLGPQERNLTFHVRTLAFSHEEDVLLRYRLDPFETDWQGPYPAASTAPRYINVPPGSYRFHIAAGWGDDGEEPRTWSAMVTSAEIRVARPLWQRPWFAVLGVLAVVAVILGVHGLRTRALRHRARELEALAVELRATIGELRVTEAERERLIEELEVKNDELTRFTYTVSHDLKSPLFTIRGFLGYLRRDARAGDLEQLEHDVGRIEVAARTMAELLDQLLELSRIGRLMNPPESVDLDDLVRESVELAAAAIAERGVEVTIAPGLGVVRGDRVRLREVFQNLVENAVKFMGDQATPRLEIGVRRDGGEQVVVVRDNGIGIDPAYHKKIFGLFERLDTGTVGTGVGLALVKRIVDLHGGRIWVESQGLGRGSTFCLTLPPERS